jgi:hypothetical protein
MENRKCNGKQKMYVKWKMANGKMENGNMEIWKIENRK